MSKDRQRLRIRQGTGLAIADGDAVQSFWCSLSLQEKRRILRFEDPELVECLFSNWQTLCISDMTCYVVGICSQDGSSKKVGNEFFAIEGFISQSAVLHEAAFYAKLALVDKPDFFDTVEHWLESPLWVGRPMLHRRDWPSLFKTSLNSWSDLVRQIFKLVEAAVYHAEQVARLKHQRVPPSKETSPSKSCKRKARKKLCALKLKAGGQLHGSNSCPVCDGTGVLLDDPCPLCVDGSDEEEAPSAAVGDEFLENPEGRCVDKDGQESGIAEEQENSTETPDSDKEQEDSAAEVQEGEDKQAEEDVSPCTFAQCRASSTDALTIQCEEEEEEVGQLKPNIAPKDLLATWSSGLDGWMRPKVRRRRRRAIQCEEEEEETSHTSREEVATWSSGWSRVGKRCDAADGLWVLFERPIRQSAGVCQSTSVPNNAPEARFLRATVKNTFVNVPDFLADVPCLARARSLPYW